MDNETPSFDKMSDEELEKFEVSEDQQTPEAPEPTPEVPPQPAPEPEAPKADPVKELAEKLELLEKRLRDKDAMIGRQGAEIGELRKQVSPKPPVEKPSTTDFLADPANAVEKLLEAKKIEEEAQKQQILQYLENNKQLTLKVIPDFDKLIPDIKAMLIAEDKLPEADVSKILENPYVVDPAQLIQLGRRAQASKELLTLREKMKNLEAKPQEVLAQLEKATKQAATVRTGSDTLPKKRTYSQTELARMSDAELDALEV